MVQMVPMGDSRGLFVFNKMLKRDDSIPKQKDGMRDITMKVHNGDKEALAAQDKSGKQFVQAFGLATGCCYCLPMHISKTMAFQSKAKKASQARFDQAYQANGMN